MLKLLIADDEKWVRRAVSGAIDWPALGVEIIAEVADGLQALEVIQRDRPDIVLTDIRMPELDGIELMRRSLKLSPQTVFIFLSGHDSFEYAQNAINLGAIGYLLKPFEPSDLMEVAQKAKGRVLSEKRRAIFSSGENASASTIEKGYYANLAETIRSYLDEHYAEEINLDTVAREFNFSPNYASKIFRSVIGCGMLDYLAERRIAKAKELLQDMRNSIGEVAARSGFKNNPKYFTKVLTSRDALGWGKPMHLSFFLLFYSLL